MHVRKKILTKYRIITSKSSADLLMPRTTWFTAFVRCNTKHIYKSKIRSKKKLNWDRETCNQSVEFHNGSGRTDCIPRQTTNFIKLEMAKKQLSYIPTSYLQSAQKQTSPPHTQTILTHILTKRLLIYLMSMLLGNSVKQFLGTASVNPW